MVALGAEVESSLKEKRKEEKERAIREQALNDAQTIIEGLGIVTGLENNIMYSSVDGLLEPYGEALFTKELEAMRGAGLTPSYQKLALNHGVNLTRMSILNFKAPKEYIPASNGIVNILTDELMPYEPKMVQEGIIFTTKFAFKYNPDAKCPKILKELKAAQPDPMTQYKILRSFALCFDRENVKRQADIWIGDHDTRKTTLLNVLQAELGKENYANQPLEALTTADSEAQRSRAQLFGKAANIFGDLQQITLKQLGMLKPLLGGDTIPMRFMYKSPIEAPLPVKFFFGCNIPPKIEEESIWNDDAFFERFRITFWEQQLKPEEIIEDYYKELITEEELSGLFNILAGILRGVWQYHDYGYTFNANETRDLWNLSLKRHGKIQQFNNEKCTLKEGDFIPVEEYLNSINLWARTKGYDKLTAAEVNADMRKICGLQSNDGRVRVWRGIGWKDTQQSELFKGQLNGFNDFNGYSSCCTRSDQKYNIERRVHQKPVKSVNNLLVEGDGILGTWFANPLRYLDPEAPKEQSRIFPANLRATITIEQRKKPYRVLADGAFQCELCPAFRVHEDSILRHIEEDHPGYSPWLCAKHGQAFDTEADLAAHYKAYSGACFERHSLTNLEA